MKLAGKTVMVTGSTKGIGRAIALRLAADGARVVVSGRNAENGAQVVGEILRAGGEGSFVRVDVSDEEQVRLAIAEVERTVGPLTVLVNNAAAIEFMEQGGDKPVADLATEDFDYILRVSVYGTFWCIKYALPGMIAAGGGAIINISSILSLGGAEQCPSYTCAKAAVNALTRQIAVDYGRAHIRSNAIAVGWVPTESDSLTVPLIGKAWDSVTLTRRGTVDDIAGIASFLASDDAAYVTGQLVVADGGVSSRSPAPDSSVMLGILGEATGAE